MFGGGGGAPSSTSAQPAPKVDDPAVQKAAAEALRRKQRQRGYRSTIISKDLMTQDTIARLGDTLGS